MFWEKYKIWLISLGVLFVCVFGYCMIPGISRWRSLPDDVSKVSMRDCLNRKIQKIILTYNEANGPFPAEKWKPDATGLGTTRDIYYRGHLIGKGNPDKSSFCIGLVFEVFMRASDDLMFSSLKVGDGGLDDFNLFRKRFYGFTKRFFADALPLAGLGIEVKDFEQARPGDLLQLWRNPAADTGKSSGHSGIFQEWLRDTENNIVGFTLFQVSGQGISILKEYFGDKPRDIDRNQTYIVRAVIRK